MAIMAQGCCIAVIETVPSMLSGGGLRIHLHDIRV